MRLPISTKLFYKANTLIPGGVNSPVRAFSAVDSVPPFISRAKGGYIYDEDGNDYIDFIGSWGAMVLGHAHPSVISAVNKVLKHGSSFGAPTKREVELAEIIAGRVPGCEMIRLVNSGTEATMSAVRLARGVTGRNKIIKFEGCYHGHGDSFLISSGSGSLTLGTPNSKGVPNNIAKDTLIAQFNEIDTVKGLIDKFGHEIAAIIIEPVMGNAGCIPPHKNFLEMLKKICINNNSLLIFDEVITGFRINMGGAAGLFGVTPDLYTFGKIIGGGMPIGAYGGKREYMEHIAPVGSVYQAGTLSGNPIAVAAGIETLNQLDINAYDKLESMSLYFENCMQSIIEYNQYPLKFIRVGSMFSLFFYFNSINTIKDVNKCDFDKFNHYFCSLLEKGIYFAPSQYEVGFISLAHTKDIIDIAIEKISSVLSSLYKNV